MPSWLVAATATIAFAVRQACRWSSMCKVGRRKLMCMVLRRPLEGLAMTHDYYYEKEDGV
jgi:hypothetical protein